MKNEQYIHVQYCISIVYKGYWWRFMPKHWSKSVFSEYIILIYFNFSEYISHIFTEQNCTIPLIWPQNCCWSGSSIYLSSFQLYQNSSYNKVYHFRFKESVFKLRCIVFNKAGQWLASSSVILLILRYRTEQDNFPLQCYIQSKKI